jgi:hypothetical protein
MNEDKPLAENLKQWSQVIEEELHVAAEGTSDALAERARIRLAQVLPEATETLVEIMHHGCKDDAVRLSACKLVFEYTVGKAVPASAKDSDTDRIIRALMTPAKEEARED